MDKRKYLALGLAGVIAFTPMATLANGSDAVTINEDKEVISEMEEVVDYIKYPGEVAEIIEDEETLSLMVKGLDDSMQDRILFHIEEDMPILSENTKEFIEIKDLKDGDEITVFYKENTPMTMSIPPQLAPDLVVVNDSDDIGFVEVSHFNESLVDIDNRLELNISDETVLADIDGDEVSKEDLENSDLMVFYTIATESIPAKTTPQKVVVLDAIEDKITSMDRLVLNGEELKLDHEMYKSDDGHYMFPIRPVSEALGYKVTWDNDERSATLTKGAQWSKVVIGEDDYNFAKMIVRLGKAPEITDSKTYVPVEFLEEALKLDVDVEDGVLNVEYEVLEDK